MNIVSMSSEYPRDLTPDMQPFNPLELARTTQKLVCSGNKRKYTAIYAVGVYGGIVTAYAVGCSLRCIYCWVGPGREYPKRYGKFYSPFEVFNVFIKIAKKRRLRKLRVSGSEPTLCKTHLLELLNLVEDVNDIDLFMLETNGTVLGADEGFVDALSQNQKVHVRVSLKAGTPEGWSRRCGATPDSFELPYNALLMLMEKEVSCHAAAMTDPRIMPQEERIRLLSLLNEIHPDLAKSLEEERIDPYEATLRRLKVAGYNVDRWPKLTEE
ncbi:MAG: radical SAM protein [Candidatus Hodarchaeota archaeon]